MNLEDFIKILNKVHNNEELTSMEIAFLDSYAIKLSSKMKENTISYDEQNALDYYVSYYDGKNDLRAQTSIAINSYYAVVNNRRKSSLSEERQRDNQPRVLRIEPNKRINNAGAIKTVAIIEITIIIGILIAILTIAFL